MLFEGKLFFVLQQVPARQSIVSDIEANGGRVLKLEGSEDFKIADHARKTCPPGSISWKFVVDAVRKGEVPDVSHYRIETLKGPSRPVGSSTVSDRTTRVPFTHDDDVKLWKYVNQKKQDNKSVKGNEIYKALAEEDPRHTWQSWRDRFVKYVSIRPPIGIERDTNAEPENGTNTNTHPKASGTQKEARSIRTPFTEADDLKLLSFVKEKVKKGMAVKGNNIYIMLEAEDSRHTYHSWRDRYLKMHSSGQTSAIDEHDADEEVVNKKDVTVNSDTGRNDEHVNPRNTKRANEDSDQALEGNRGAHANADAAVDNDHRIDGQVQNDQDPEGDEHDSAIANEEPLTARQNDVVTALCSRDFKDFYGKPFTREDVVIIVETMSDIEQIDHGRWQEAWKLWGETYGRHTAQDWASFYTNVVAPEYKKSETEMPTTHVHAVQEADIPAEMKQFLQKPSVDNGLCSSDMKKRKRDDHIAESFGEDTEPKPRQSSSNAHSDVSGGSPSDRRPSKRRILGSERLVTPALAEMVADAVATQSPDDTLRDATHAFPSSNNRTASKTQDCEPLQPSQERTQWAFDQALKKKTVDEPTISVQVAQYKCEELTEHNLASQQTQRNVKSSRGIDLLADDEDQDQSKYIDWLQDIVKAKASSGSMGSDDHVGGHTPVQQGDKASANTARSSPNSRASSETKTAFVREHATETARPATASPSRQEMGSSHGLTSDPQREDLNLEFETAPQWPDLVPSHENHKGIIESSSEATVLASNNGDEDYEIDFSIASPPGGFSPEKVRLGPVQASQQRCSLFHPSQQEGRTSTEDLFPHLPSSSPSLTSDNAYRSRSSRPHQQSNSNRHVGDLDTQAIMDAETQQPDFSLALPESDVVSISDAEMFMPDSNTLDDERHASTPPPQKQHRQASESISPKDAHLRPPTYRDAKKSSIDNDTGTNDEEDVTDFVGRLVSRGYDIVDIEKALHLTTLQVRLAEKVLIIQKQGLKIPETVAGIWTEEDDAAVVSSSSRKLKYLEEKHGKGSIESRTSYLIELDLDSQET